MGPSTLTGSPGRATGTTCSPWMPRFPGQFTGEVRHSVADRSPMEFRGRRVLVVGLGNSGADIVCDAVLIADASFLSVRRGYDVIPKQIFGIPADQFGELRPVTPAASRAPDLHRTAESTARRPDPARAASAGSQLFESHPLLNSQLLHYLQHGDVTVRADVAAFEGDRVRFTDGSTEQVDLVLFATGYNWTVPYVPKEYFRWRDGRPGVPHGFQPGALQPLRARFLEVNSSAYTLFDQRARPGRAGPRPRRCGDPGRSSGLRPNDRHGASRPERRHPVHRLGAAPVLRRRTGVSHRAAGRVTHHIGWQPLRPGMFARLKQGPPR